MYLKRAAKARAKNLGFYRRTVYDVISFKFHWRRYSTPAHSLLTLMGMGDRRKFSRAGQNPQHQKSWLFFMRQSRKRNILALLRHFRLHVRGLIASAEGASQNIRVFHRRAAYDVIFFKFHGGDKCPSLPPPCERPCPWTLALWLANFVSHNIYTLNLTSIRRPHEISRTSTNIS